MKTPHFFIILFFFSVNSIAQNETNNWLFGNNAWLNFNAVKVTSSSGSQMSTPAGSASISDKNGDLLFYTNGETVWNKNHLIMENGSGLAGDTTNTQPAIIIPKPGSNTIYYIFTTRRSSSDSFSSGLKYSEVEISSTYPLGKVITKNFLLNVFHTERITAIHSEDGNAIWVISFGTRSSENGAPIDTFSIYKVDNFGVNRFRNAYTFSEGETSSSSGAMKISPDGKIIAIANYSFGDREYIYLYDFNKATGEVSFKKKIHTAFSPFAHGVHYGVEFSQDSRILYYTCDLGTSSSYVIQYQLYDTDDLYVFDVIKYSTQYNFRGIQLASDGKIYITKTLKDGSETPYNYLAVIEDPNSILDYNFQDDKIKLDPGKSTKGLPNFIQSYFASRIITENKCVFDTFNFSAISYLNIDSILWDFGDGNTSTSLAPNYSYSTSGTKIVTATLKLPNNTTVIVRKKIEVYPLPNLASNQELVQCDDDFDGISQFNLYNIREKITNAALNETLYFYETISDANSDSNRIQNPENYQNKIPNQEIFIKAISEYGCEQITSFHIKANYVQLANISSLYVCEDSDSVKGDSKGSFSLIQKKIDIIAELSLPRNTDLKFYKSRIDALTTTDEISGDYITATATLWVRVENSTGCGGIQSFEAIVNPQPINTINDNYTICYNINSNPITLTADGSNDRFEWQNEVGIVLSTAQNFELKRTGTFTLKVFKTENNIECYNAKTFKVVYKETPTFGEILVDTSTENKKITVNINGNSSYEFSLDNTTFFGSSDSYTFTNVNPGIHTIYVRDIANCEPQINTKVTVLDYPKFLTPNNDGINDTWKISGVNNQFFSSVEVQIFNRQGKLIHTLNEKNYEYGWDGTFNGIKLSSGNYWFSAKLIDYDKNTINKTGHFSLLRK